MLSIILLILRPAPFIILSIVSSVRLLKNGSELLSVQVIHGHFLMSLVAWACLFLMCKGLWSFLRDVIKQTERMHRIPCAECQFFTENYHLKCPVHPKIALSEFAINCPDFHEEGT